jgi:hypothetical protein
MRLEFTLVIENDEWSDEEYDEKSERTVILENADIVDAIKRILPLEEGEYLEDVWIVKEINK